MDNLSQCENGHFYEKSLKRCPHCSNKQLFTQCENGHFYESLYTTCPHCPKNSENRNGEPEISIHKPTREKTTFLKDRYKFNKKTDLIGQGGYGNVYKAFDQILQRNVALKITELSPNSKYSLSREAHILFKIDHPNIIKYFDVFKIEENNGEYEVIIMEYAGKGSLKDLNKNNSKIEFVVLNEILKGILAGINYIHGLSIVHRDIKPANIFLSEDSEGRIIPKIGDFYLSLFYPIKLISSNPSLFPNKKDITFTVAGTPAYMAPEQFEDYGKIGPLSDFWGFGMTLAELLLGRSPINKSGPRVAPSDISKEVKQFDIKHFLVNNKFPKAYVSVLRLCLQQDLGKRVSDVKILIHILDSSIDEGSFSLPNSNFESSTNTKIEKTVPFENTGSINPPPSDKNELDPNKTIIGNFKDFEESLRLEAIQFNTSSKKSINEDNTKNTKAILKEELLNLFRKDRIEECFDSLVKVIKLNNTDLIILENQWHNNQRKFKFGLITYEQENLSSNRIKLALLNFIEDMIDISISAR